MQDALLAMIETQETARSQVAKARQVQDPSYIHGPPRRYEKLIQKLEGEIRGHIRMEHEMKLHMDYLENKLEL